MCDEVLNFSNGRWGRRKARVWFRNGQELSKEARESLETGYGDNMLGRSSLVWFTDPEVQPRDS